MLHQSLKKEEMYVPLAKCVANVLYGTFGTSYCSHWGCAQLRTRPKYRQAGAVPAAPTAGKPIWGRGGGETGQVRGKGVGLSCGFHCHMLSAVVAQAA